MKILLIPIPKSASASLANTLRNLHGFNKEELVKMHYFPNKENLKVLKNQKKVVLLRDPRACLEASKRAIDSLITPEEREDKEGFLVYDYEGFYNGWIENIDKNTLLIHYKDLIRNPQAVINSIEKFYGLKESKNVKLSKLNYSRSKTGHLKRRIFIQLKKIKLLRNIRNTYFPERLKTLTMVNK